MDVVEASPAIMMGRATRHVTSQANDSRVHASPSPLESIAKLVSLYRLAYKSTDKVIDRCLQVHY